MNDIWDKLRDLHELDNLKLIDEHQLEKTVGFFGCVLLINFILNVIGLLNCLYICIHLLFVILVGVYLAKKMSP